MIKKTVTYTDFNGKSRTEHFYFNLNEAEVIELEYSQEGGLVETIQRISEETDGRKIIEIFKDLLLKSVGRKSVDGKLFEKNDKIRNDFAQSGAYSKLFMELATDADKAAAFVNGILPKIPKDSQPKN